MNSIVLNSTEAPHTVWRGALVEAQSLEMNGAIAGLYSRFDESEQSIEAYERDCAYEEREAWLYHQQRFSLRD